MAELRQYVLVKTGNGEFVALNRGETMWHTTNDFLKAHHFANDFMATNFIINNPTENFYLVHAKIKVSKPMPLHKIIHTKHTDLYG